jgi:predicted ATPase/DNA-binding CsgD family transcriptional regulator/TolA-binding protein
VTLQRPGPVFRPGRIDHPERNAFFTLPPVGGLVGRDHDVGELVRRLADVRMLTVTGPPGVGKSRLALEVAGRLRIDGMLDAVIVSVEDMTSASQLEATVAHALGEAENLAPADGSPSGGIPLVVVLDDCDHLLRACADVAHTLLGRGVPILATAREPLGVLGESTWRLPPLSVPHCESDESEFLTASDAVRLLCDRAAHANRGFVATPDTASAIVEICRRLDGLPLAIELVARVMTAYSPAEVVDHLDDPFPLLSSGPRTVHPRHQSLWACLAWSYDLLSVPEQMVLEGLAVFPGVFTGEAAVDVCIPEGMAEPEFQEVLRALVDKSLVEVEAQPGGTCYRLLGMMRWFGLEKLAAGGEEKAYRDEHGRWCEGMVTAAGDPRRGRRWLERMQPFHPDVHAALEWALASGAAETAVVLGEADVRLCRAKGRYGEARGRAHQLAATPAPPVLHARAVTESAMADVAAGDVDGALGHLDEAVALAEAASIPTELARAQVSRALAQVVSVGRSALSALEAAALAVGEGSDRDLVIDALNALGGARLLVGQPALAHEAFTKSSALAGDHGDEVGQAHALVGLGAASVLLGRYGDAEDALLPGLSLARAVGEGGAAALALTWMGETARLQGNDEVAGSWFVQAIDQASAADHPEAKARALLGLGRIAAECGDQTMAGRMFDDVLATARDASLLHLVAPALCGLADLTADAADAQSLVAQALGAAQTWGDQPGEALALEHLARLTRRQGDLKGATARHCEALGLRAEVGDPAPIAASLEALAAIAGERDDACRAARLVGAADALRDRHGCTRAAGQRGEHALLAESLCESLGEGPYAAERRHGASLSTKSAVAYAAGRGGKRKSRPGTGLEALTAGQRRIAELVAEGLSNGEIARKLGISPTTVKAHLRSVFSKVGVENRTALAAALHRSGR